MMNTNDRSQHDGEESHTQKAVTAKATRPGWTVASTQGVSYGGCTTIILVPRSAIAQAIHDEIGKGINPLSGCEIEGSQKTHKLWAEVASWARLYGPESADLEAGAAKDHRVSIRCAGHS